MRRLIRINLYKPNVLHSRKVHESGEAKAEKYLKEKRGEAEPVSGENDDDKKGKKTKQKTETKKKQ